MNETAVGEVFVREKEVLVMLLPCLLLGGAGFFAARRESEQAKIDAANAKIGAAQSKIGTAPSKIAVAQAQPWLNATTKLIVKELKIGNGTVATNGKRLTVHYSGRFTNGVKFDASLDRGEPFDFQLGAGEVIAGWDRGLVGMKVNGRRELIIPPALAYGKTATGGIPPNSVLIYTVQLLQVD